VYTIKVNNGTESFQRKIIIATNSYVESDLINVNECYCNAGFSMIHGLKEVKMAAIRSNRHRRQIASDTNQSRISKNSIYSKQDVTRMPIK
jgi:hypothetical protein